jgi:hypothetical protein
LHSPAIADIILVIENCFGAKEFSRANKIEEKANIKKRDDPRR